MPASRRVRRVVKERDLPALFRAAQLFLEPFDLRLIEIRAVEGEEPDVLLWRFQAVIELALHVVRLVKPLLARVVVAEARVELDARIEQRAVRFLELLDEVLRPLRTIDVVADHNYDRERLSLVGREQLPPRFVLLGVTRAVVANHSKG